MAGIILSRRDAARLQRMLKKFEGEAPVRRDRRRHAPRDAAGAGTFKWVIVRTALTAGDTTYDVWLEEEDGEEVTVNINVFGDTANDLANAAPLLSVGEGFYATFRSGAWWNLSDFFAVEDCD